MPFITDDDHQMHHASRLPSWKHINPKAYSSPEDYLTAVARQMANYARMAYRRGIAAHAQAWVYASGLSDTRITQVVTKAAQEYVGKAPSVSVTAHTTSMSQGETSVNLALVVHERKS